MPAMPRGAPRLRKDNGHLNGVAERVQQTRTRLKLTRDQLNGRIAFATNGKWSPSAQEVLHIELGVRTVTDIEVSALAAALGVDPCWLLIG